MYSSIVSGIKSLNIRFDTYKFLEKMSEIISEEFKSIKESDAIVFFAISKSHKIFDSFNEKFSLAYLIDSKYLTTEKSRRLLRMPSIF